MTVDQIRLLEQVKQGDKSAAEEMLTQNSGLIWSVVRRFVGRGVEADDLYQLGCIGFLKAMDGFDLQFGTQFSTYAVPKIAGEMRRFIRDDGAVKVSRTLKERSASIKMTRQRLLGQLDREPTLLEISSEMGLTPEEIAAAETATAATESINRETGTDGFTLESVLSSGSMEEEILESVALRDALKRLPERERTVIGLRFFHGLTQEKTAKIIGVSQVQISRLERRALKEMKSYF